MIVMFTYRGELKVGNHIRFNLSIFSPIAHSNSNSSSNTSIKYIYKKEDYFNCYNGFLNYWIGNCY
jgi:hypothetical protein